MDAKDGSDIKTNTAKALSLFGEHPQIFISLHFLGIYFRGSLAEHVAQQSAAAGAWASVLTTDPIVMLQIKSIPTKATAHLIGTEYLLPTVTSLPIQANAQLHT